MILMQGTKIILSNVKVYYLWKTFSWNLDWRRKAYSSGEIWITISKLIIIFTIFWSLWTFRPPIQVTKSKFRKIKTPPQNWSFWQILMEKITPPVAEKFKFNYRDNYLVQSFFSTFEQPKFWCKEANLKFPQLNSLVQAENFWLTPRSKNWTLYGCGRRVSEFEHQRSSFLDGF